MEIILRDAPAAYAPGDMVRGEVKVTLSQEQQTIKSASICLLGISGIVQDATFKGIQDFDLNHEILKQEAQLFDGPYTLQRQTLVWPFEFRLPSNVVWNGQETPLPPSAWFNFSCSSGQRRSDCAVAYRYFLRVTLRRKSVLNGTEHLRKKILVRPVLCAPLPVPLARNAMLLAVNEAATDTRARQPGSNAQTEALACSYMSISLPVQLSHHYTTPIKLSKIPTSATNLDGMPQLLRIHEIFITLKCNVKLLHDAEMSEDLGRLRFRPPLERTVNSRASMHIADVGLRDFVAEEQSYLPDFETKDPDLVYTHSLSVLVVVREETTRKLTDLRCEVSVVVLPRFAWTGYEPSNTCGEAPPAYQEQLTQEA